jgi:protein-tyrosine phosphatase
VLVHCVGGRDRTGQVVMLLLALVGVSPDVIAADYALTEEGRPEAEEFLAGRGTTVAAVIASTLAGLDLEAHLRAAGLTDDDFSALRARLLS